MTRLVLHVVHIVGIARQSVRIDKATECPTVKQTTAVKRGPGTDPRRLHPRRPSPSPPCRPSSASPAGASPLTTPSTPPASTSYLPRATTARRCAPRRSARRARSPRRPVRRRPRPTGGGPAAPPCSTPRPPLGTAAPCRAAAKKNEGQPGGRQDPCVAARRRRRRSVRPRARAVGDEKPTARVGAAPGTCGLPPNGGGGAAVSGRAAVRGGWGRRAGRGRRRAPAGATRRRGGRPPAAAAAARAQGGPVGESATCRASASWGARQQGPAQTQCHVVNAALSTRTPGAEGGVDHVTWSTPPSAAEVEMCILTPRCEISMKFQGPSHRPFPP